MERWYRLSVDVTGLGEVVGMSAEKHEDGELTSLLTTQPSEDLTLVEAIEDIRTWAMESWGVQLSLWP